MLTRTLAEEGRLLFLTEPLPRKDKPILKTLRSEPWTKPKPRNKANQNHRKPKRKPETMKPILATWQNQLELMPAKKTLPNEKAENLPTGGCAKTCLLKKYWPKTLLWKVPPLKTNWLYELKITTPEKRYFSQKRNLRIKGVFGFALGWLTVCVTCAGAGTAKPSSQKNEKA